MTTKLLLTPEEIRIAIKKAHEKKPGVLLPVGDIYDALLQAQLDKAGPILEKQKDKEWQERLRQEILGNEIVQIANIEEVRKDERERIADEIEKEFGYYTDKGLVKITVDMRFARAKWQALKEKK